MILVCDLEADELRYKATRIWCIVAIDVDTEEVHQFPPDKLEDGLRLLSQADKIVFHNGFMFDIPLIKRLYPWWTYKSADDTFIMSALFNPDRMPPPGTNTKHSIEAWGLRFGRIKPQHDDWSKYTTEMLNRCTEDAWIGLETYRYLSKKRLEWDWEQALKLEYAIAKLQVIQEDTGIVFDKKKAIDLWVKIVQELQHLNKRLLKTLPLRCVQYGAVVSKPFKKDGTHPESVLKWYDNKPPKIGGPFTRIQFEEFNLNSEQQIKEYLLIQGWVPDEWNYKKDGKKWVYDEAGHKIKTSPKITESSLEKVKSGMAALLARRSILMHRKGLIYTYSTGKKKPLGWFTNVRKDGRIEAKAIPQACNTGRFQHSVIVNCPKANSKVVYGKECRELFRTPDGYTLVGADAKALEARTEAHNCFIFKGGEEYAKELLEGDIHSKNAVVFGCDRDGAKPVKYGCTYGASPGKIAEILGVSLARGEEIYNSFWESNTALKEFKEDVIKEFKNNKKKYGKGFIVGLDGRQLIGRSEHSLVNLKFQSDGAILMKTAECYLFNLWIPKYNLDAKKVLDFHDEFQALVRNDHVEKYVELAYKSFIKAGEFYNYRVPIEGDIKCGQNWAETH